MEEKEKQSQEGTNKKNRTAVFIILIFILTVGLVFFYQQTLRLEEEKEQQQREITDTYLKLDSVSTQLTSRIEKIRELGGEIDTLVSIQAQLEEDKRNLLLQSKSQSRQISTLRDRVEGYKELLLIKDEEIKQLQIINEQLAEENVSLKDEKNQLNQSIQELQQNSDELANKVAIASKLQISGMKISAVSKTGKERDQEFRNRHIDQLKVQFTVLDNQIAPIEGKDILLRILGPDGNVLFDVTRGSGSFTFQGRELFFTGKQEILYDRNRQLVTFMYDKGSDYAVGQHKVEVYTDGYLMGQGIFMVK